MRARNSARVQLTKSALLSTLALFWLACASEELVKPLPPDTSELVEDLESPSGKFEAIPAAEQATLLEGALDQVERVCGTDAMERCDSEAECSGCELLDRIARTLREVTASIGTGGGRQVSIPGVEGILFAHVRCPGWQANASKSASGSIEATIGFTGRGLDPIVWGSFERCRQGSGDDAYELDGDFTITFEPQQPVPFEQIAQSTAVFGYEGNLRLRSVKQALPLRLALRSRLDGKGSREIMFDSMGYGTFVAEMRADDITVRGRDVSFRCDLEESRCEASTR